MREKLLRRIEESLSTISSWFTVRRAARGSHLELLAERLESVRREIQKAATQSAHHALARARATIDEMERDEAAPPPPAALRREELQALRRHLQLTATLLPRVSNLDHPGWRSAHADYERSWGELSRAFAGGTPPPSS